MITMMPSNRFEPQLLHSKVLKVVVLSLVVLLLHVLASPTLAKKLLEQRRRKKSCHLPQFNGDILTMSIIACDSVMPLTDARPIMSDCIKCQRREMLFVMCSEHISSRLLVDVPVFVDLDSTSSVEITKEFYSYNCVSFN